MQTPRSSCSLVSLAFVLATLLAPNFVNAAECTTDELQEIQTTYTSAMSGSSSVCSDVTMGSNYCDDSECLAFMTKLMDTLPDCTTSGINVQDSVSYALAYCDSLGTEATDTSASKDTTVSDAPADDTAASTSAVPTSMYLHVAALGLAIGAIASL